MQGNLDRIVEIKNGVIVESVIKNYCDQGNYREAWNCVFKLEELKTNYKILLNQGEFDEEKSAAVTERINFLEDLVEKMKNQITTFSKQ
jgi:hypothetical protein